MTLMVFTAATIASNLGVPVQAIHRLADSGALPTLHGGLHDQAWATWLCIGRRVGARWCDGATAASLVAFGWRHTLGRKPAPANLQALGELFVRNGLTVAHAMQALAATHARLETA